MSQQEKAQDHIGLQKTMVSILLKGRKKFIAQLFLVLGCG